MNIILFGATGMVGSSVLREGLLDDGIGEVLAIGRRPTGRSHRKLRELVRPDMFDFRVAEGELAGYDAAFFCLGVSSIGRSEAEYAWLTRDLTLGWARTVGRQIPAVRFLYVSGAGSGGASGWARIKGRTERDLLDLLPGAAMIRPGAVRPMHGERPTGRGGGLLARLVAPLWPALSLLGPRLVVTSEELGRAMILIAQAPGRKRIFENASLVRLGRAGTLCRGAA